MVGLHMLGKYRWGTVLCKQTWNGWFHFYTKRNAGMMLWYSSPCGLIPADGCHLEHHFQHTGEEKKKKKTFRILIFHFLRLHLVASHIIPNQPYKRVGSRVKRPSPKSIKQNFGYLCIQGNKSSPWWDNVPTTTALQKKKEKKKKNAWGETFVPSYTAAAFSQE